MEGLPEYRHGTSDGHFGFAHRLGIRNGLFSDSTYRLEEYRLRDPVCWMNVLGEPGGKMV